MHSPTFRRYIARMPKTAQPPPSADLVPTSVAAELLRVDVATVNRWAKTGRLPVAVKIPGLRGPNLYRRADVEALLADVAS